MNMSHRQARLNTSSFIIDKSNPLDTILTSTQHSSNQSIFFLIDQSFIMGNAVTERIKMAKVHFLIVVQSV